MAGPALEPSMPEPSTPDVPSDDLPELPELPSELSDGLLAELQSFAASDAAVLDEIDALLTRLLDAAAHEPEPAFDPDAIWARVEQQVWGG